MKTIEVLPYDPNWQRAYERERADLLATLTDTVVDSKRASVSPSANQHLAIEHIGSTAVFGLAAKPIIDILLLPERIEQLDGLEHKFESLGYECMGEFGLPGRRYYRKGGAARTHQIHAFTRGSHAALRHLAFRDYLKAHPEIAREYADVKRYAAQHCANDISRYCDLKNDFVSKHEALALSWV